MADVVVIVPILGRPHHAAPLMESFRANTPENRAVLLPVASVVDPVDSGTWAATMDAWCAAGVCPIKARRGYGFSFAAKVNAAYEITSEPWLLLVGSDVRFHLGWLEAALMTAEMTGAKLIATNDMHNHRVMAGEHATHPLINREWIDSHGSSWDGPGVVCHEGYKHQFVDNEWSAVARQAGVFAYSEGSKIEHLHPVWGLAEVDATYELGESSKWVDLALFEERLAKYGDGT